LVDRPEKRSLYKADREREVVSQVLSPNTRKREQRSTSNPARLNEEDTPMEPLLLKAGDVAKLLGLGRSKVFAMLAVRELPVIRIGRSVRVPRAALEDWIAEHTQHTRGRSGDAGPPFVGYGGSGLHP